MDKLHLSLLCPPGVVVPVEVSGYDRVADLLTTVKSIAGPQQILLLHNGGVLDLNSTLQRSGVTDGDSIVVFARTAPKSNNESNDDCEYFSEQKIITLIHELLRNKDMILQTLDMSSKSRVVYEKYIDHQEEMAYSSCFKTPTKIPEKADGVSTAPLPLLFDDSDEDIEDEDEIYDEEEDELTEDDFILGSSFGSIEEAYKFFSNQIWSDWCW